MLTELRLRGFKSWRDTGDVRLAPVTVLFGSNSSGKTSLIQSLLLLRQTTESADRNRVLELGSSSTLIDLGTYEDIAFNHSFPGRLEVTLAWTADKAIEIIDLAAQAKKKSSTLASSKNLTFSVDIRLDKNGAAVQRLKYSLGDTTFALTEKDLGKYELTSDRYNFVRSPGRAWPLPAPTRFYGFPDQVRLYYQNAGFLSELELELEAACSRIKYLGPLREDPRRQYTFSGGAPTEVGRRGELAVSALISSREASTRVSRGWQKGIHRRRLPRIPLVQLVAEWLTELGMIASFELESLDPRETLYQVLVRRSPGSAPVLLTDVGFGVSQVLPVLVLLAYADQGDTVILEQPEIHLHPAVQSGLADIIVETVMARGVQVVVESHSEHLLTRLQRRVAEHQLERGIVLEPEDVALYFCDQADGQSSIHSLELDLFGNISNWPADFFGNPMEDSVAMLEAAAQRGA